MHSPLNAKTKTTRRKKLRRVICSSRLKGDQCGTFTCSANVNSTGLNDTTLARYPSTWVDDWGRHRSGLHFGSDGDRATAGGLTSGGGLASAGGLASVIAAARSLAAGEKLIQKAGSLRAAARITSAVARRNFATTGGCFASAGRFTAAVFGHFAEKLRQKSAAGVGRAANGVAATIGLTPASWFAAGSGFASASWFATCIGLTSTCWLFASTCWFAARIGFTSAGRLFTAASGFATVC